MSRQKITEYIAKTSLFPAFNLTYVGFAANPTTTTSQIKEHFGDQNLVVKVDQGIKKRGKLGLVKVNVTASEIPKIIKEWGSLGWTNFLIEPVLEHSRTAEHYLALERTREGWAISYTNQGGIEVESSWDSVKRTVLKRSSRLHAEKGSMAVERTVLEGIQTIIPLLDTHHIAFIEMNPIIVRDNQIIPLDMAVEVDSTASSLPTLPDRVLVVSEQAIVELDNSTPASLKFRLINPKGRIWMLLSGGGASLVLADEVADLGLGRELANYGEYSGAPTDDDVYSYTKIILHQILKSPTHSLPKQANHNSIAIIIAGGVANFTDVAKTFNGLIRALDEQKIALQKANVKVFVRRGGPNEFKGLTMMRDFLGAANLLGSVHGHDIPLTQVVSEAKHYLSAKLQNWKTRAPNL